MIDPETFQSLLDTLERFVALRLVPLEDEVERADRVPDTLRNRLGIAIAQRTYRAYREAVSSPRWQRVYNLADFAFFDHRVHVENGVGCTSCHGKIGDMPLTMKAGSLSMAWCLDCHRNPSPRLRTRDRIFDGNWQPSGNVPHPELMDAYGIDEPSRLVQCSICHR